MLQNSQGLVYMDSNLWDTLPFGPGISYRYRNSDVHTENVTAIWQLWGHKLLYGGTFL